MTKLVTNPKPDAPHGDPATTGLLARVERGEAPEAVTRAIELLAEPSKPVRRAAAAALAAALARGDVATDAVEPLLLGGRDAERWGVAWALAQAGLATPAAVDVLVGALESRDVDRRWAATAAVATLAREHDDLRARLRGLSSGGSPQARKMALICLCDGGERDGGVFRAALSDEDPFVRLAALTSLARLGDRSPASLQAISAVVERDPEDRVRRGAGAVLRRLGGETESAEEP